ncbi:hypothetical protein STAS_03822 [Striga asiatica]|uniref:Uncharacterized protein n=1 Tax=Striga asiatica TaxID=4170 RepID=A0A5A7P572_STRAF|nr:hypothetical protein STAS_03822 [Striga asiatica]
MDASPVVSEDEHRPEHSALREPPHSGDDQPGDGGGVAGDVGQRPPRIPDPAVRGDGRPDVGDAERRRSRRVEPLTGVGLRLLRRRVRRALLHQLPAAAVDGSAAAHSPPLLPRNGTQPTLSRDKRPGHYKQDRNEGKDNE